MLNIEHKIHEISMKIDRKSNEVLVIMLVPFVIVVVCLMGDCVCVHCCMLI